MSRASYARVQATVGVGTVLIWDFGVAYTRGGGTCAVQTLGLSGAPPGDNCNHQEASRKEQEVSRSQSLLATIQKALEDRSCAFKAVWVGASWDGALVFDH